jgi:formyl-CoA transferase
MGGIMEPLHDIRVLAVTVFLAGPFLSMNLARLGAEVIKVEVPKRGDPVRGNSPFAGPQGIHPTRQTEEDISTLFLKRTQGVKSVTINLKHPEGRQMFLDLAKQSDVVLENLALAPCDAWGWGTPPSPPSTPVLSIARFPATDKPALTPSSRRTTRRFRA